MSKAQPSPGPWRRAGLSVEDLEESPILARHWAAAGDLPDDVAEANADLASRAWSMLDLLRRIRLDAKDLRETGNEIVTHRWLQEIVALVDAELGDL